MKFINDGITYIKNNKYYAFSCLAILYTLYLLQQIGSNAREESRLLEGYDNENLEPANIEEAIKSLRKTNIGIKDKLHCKKYKRQYEDYLIELYDYVNLSALGECVRPDTKIKNKMKNLKIIENRYAPLKQLVNESMETLHKEIKDGLKTD
tara:strand:- start:330 stop:782 length:453 start_codon:yes stop_codon:yes gene_type:complete